MSIAVVEYFGGFNIQKQVMGFQSFNISKMRNRFCVMQSLTTTENNKFLDKFLHQQTCENHLSPQRHFACAFRRDENFSLSTKSIF